LSSDVNEFEPLIYGCGCPRISAGFTFRRRRNALEFAIKLDGSPQAAAWAHTLSLLSST
jgi:hypothetical protein